MPLIFVSIFINNLSSCTRFDSIGLATRDIEKIYSERYQCLFLITLSGRLKILMAESVCELVKRNLNTNGDLSDTQSDKRFSSNKKMCNKFCVNTEKVLD